MPWFAGSIPFRNAAAALLAATTKLERCIREFLRLLRARPTSMSGHISGCGTAATWFGVGYSPKSKRIAHRNSKAASASRRRHS